MTIALHDAIDRARTAWERSQPQTFIDFGALTERDAPPPVSLLEGAEPTAALTTAADPHALVFAHLAQSDGTGGTNQPHGTGSSAPSNHHPQEDRP